MNIKGRAIVGEHLNPTFEIKIIYFYFSSGNAVAGIYEFLIKKITKKHIDVSRLFIYYNGRLKDGHHPMGMQDSGASISGVITGMQEYGCCSENVWKYVLPTINRQPSNFAYQEAKKYRVIEAKPLPTDLTHMKGCLAAGYPFVFALKLFDSFFRATQNKGRVSIPQPHEQQAAQHGWHAMVAVGYSDKSQSFFIRNSWGTEWVISSLKISFKFDYFFLLG